MNDDAERILKLFRQQASIASFGMFALGESNLQTVLTEAARVCAQGLNVPFAKVCRYRLSEKNLLVVAGYGWRADVVGHVISRPDRSTPQGRVFITGKPSICNDLSKESAFELPPFYAAHGIVSTVGVLIKGGNQPFGVLEIDNDQQQDYDQHDIDFLTGFANVLGEAVATAARVEVLQTTIQQMKLLVEEKDRLLDQKKVLAEELQHRVRNNLQLVYAMLDRQLDETADQTSQRGLRAIARRVSTLAQVYENLLGTELTRSADFGRYINSLCLKLADIQAPRGGNVTLTCDSETLLLDLDVVTALGIVTTELVTNSFDHAFPGGQGAITVSVQQDDPGLATMTISDDGEGFEAKEGSKRQGLGLVRRLIEQVRGTVTVDSVHGTTWKIRFPAAPAVQ